MILQYLVSSVHAHLVHASQPPPCPPPSVFTLNQTTEQALRRDTGYPRVFFAQPLPVPVNTVPVRGRVRVYHGNALVYMLNHTTGHPALISTRGSRMDSLPFRKTLSRQVPEQGIGPHRHPLPCTP